MSFTPNKTYNNQPTGSDVGTWGIVNNSNFTSIDLNFGGRKNANVAGGGNVNVTAADAQNVYHLLTGMLTGDIQYIFPATGGFYFIQNNTTGAFTVKVIIAGGTSGFIIPQSQTSFLFANPDNFIPAGIISNTFVGGTTGGTANAQILVSVTPGPWALAVGNIIYSVAGFSNNAATTFAGPDGVAKSVKKNLDYSGLAPLTGGEIIVGGLLVLYWDGTEYILLNPTPVPGQIAGSTTNDSALAGNVGEIVSNSASTQSLATGIPSNITNITLSAGDWDIWGSAAFNGTGSTIVNQQIAAITATSATIPSFPNGGALFVSTKGLAPGEANSAFPVGIMRVSINTPTTYYLVAQATFSSSTLTSSAFLAARRRR